MVLTYIRMFLTTWLFSIFPAQEKIPAWSYPASVPRGWCTVLLPLDKSSSSSSCSTGCFWIFSSTLACIQSQIKMPAGRLEHTQPRAKSSHGSPKCCYYQEVLVAATVPKHNSSIFIVQNNTETKGITALKTRNWGSLFPFDVAISLLELSTPLGLCV